MNKLADNIIGDIPEIMYENEIDYMVENFEDRLKTQGIDLDSYIKYTATTLETLRENFAPQAKQQVRIRLALETVAKEEGLTASEDELEEEYKKIADSYKMPVDRIKAIIPADGLEKDIVVRKAIDVVKASAVAGEEKAEEKPAKKPAAKKTEEKPAAKKPAAKKPAAKKDK